MVAKVVRPARISVRKAVFLISFFCINVLAKVASFSDMSTTYMTTALQAKDTTKGRLRDRLVDGFRIITKESHIESSDCLKMQTEEKVQRLKTTHNDERLEIET